jgi:hypothetical protein
MAVEVERKVCMRQTAGMDAVTGAWALISEPQGSTRRFSTLPPTTISNQPLKLLQHCLPYISIMPVLTFEQSPPNAEVFIDLSSPPKLAPKTTQLHDVKSASAQIQDVEPTLPNNAYPVVRLDVDVISEATASRLAASLLGHVLFLKNQIPL